MRLDFKRLRKEMVEGIWRDPPEFKFDPSLFFEGLEEIEEAKFEPIPESEKKRTF